MEIEAFVAFLNDTEFNAHFEQHVGARCPRLSRSSLLWNQ
jgi:hypothetical protein